MVICEYCEREYGSGDQSYKGKYCVYCTMGDPKKLDNFEYVEDFPETKWGIFAFDQKTAKHYIDIVTGGDDNWWGLYSKDNMFFIFSHPYTPKDTTIEGFTLIEEEEFTLMWNDEDGSGYWRKVKR